MYDKNHCRFSGTIQDFKRIDTRTGTLMTSFKLKCWKETIKVVAFKENAIDLINGSRVEITGKLQSSSWEYEGQKYHGFQIVAESVGADPIRAIRPDNQEKGPKSDIVNNRTEPKSAEFGQQGIPSFEGCPF